MIPDPEWMPDLAERVVILTAPIEDTNGLRARHRPERRSVTADGGVVHADLTAGHRQPR